MQHTEEQTNFLKIALFSAGRIGAVARSSRRLILRAAACLPEKSHTVIEYGPGDGAMTRILLERLAPDGKLLVIEPNAQFVSVLRGINDKRLEIIEGRVEDVDFTKLKGLERVDAVVASIPFSLMTSAVRRHIVLLTHSMLRPGGHFIIFHQYTHFMEKSLKECFTSVSTKFEPRNIFPCFIFDAER